jgi:hypothetical protein
LLVEAFRRLARLVAIGWPETGRVGGEYLVDQDDVVAFHAEFELRVGDDNALLLGYFSGAGVDR